LSYTQPDGQPQGMAREFTNKLREILIGEIIAINGYQSHIAHSNIEAVNQAWHSIMLDEKKHYGWILKLLRKYDPEQYHEYVVHKTDAPGSKTPIITRALSVDDQTILNHIRDDIKGELEAVILYEQQITSLPYRDIRTTLQAIINEEKGHAEHLTRLLLKYDPDIYDELVSTRLHL